MYMYINVDWFAREIRKSTYFMRKYMSQIAPMKGYLSFFNLLLLIFGFTIHESHFMYNLEQTYTLYWTYTSCRWKKYIFNEITYIFSITLKMKGFLSFSACLPIYFGFSIPWNPYMRNFVLSAGSEHPCHFLSHICYTNSIPTYELINLTWLITGSSVRATISSEDNLMKPSTVIPSCFHMFHR